MYSDYALNNIHISMMQPLPHVKIQKNFQEEPECVYFCSETKFTLLLALKCMLGMISGPS